MAVEILKDEIRPPAQNNLTWMFQVRVNGGQLRTWKVDTFDLSLWFREAVGRYPRHDRGDSDVKRDIRENWETFEPRLRREAEEELLLAMKVVVSGERTSEADWEWARTLPEPELPPLNDLQREAAQKLNASEEQYSRRYAAAQRSLSALIANTERVGRYLQHELQQIRPEAGISEIVLDADEEKFSLKVQLDGQSVPVRIQERVVNELFEAGSREAEERIHRIFEIALLTRAAQ